MIIWFGPLLIAVIFLLIDMGRERTNVKPLNEEALGEIIEALYDVAMGYRERRTDAYKLASDHQINYTVVVRAFEKKYPGIKCPF